MRGEEIAIFHFLLRLEKSVKLNTRENSFRKKNNSKVFFVFCTMLDSFFNIEKWLTWPGPATKGEECLLCKFLRAGTHIQFISTPIVFYAR